MKLLKMMFFFSFLLVFSINSYSQNVAINADGSPPNPSAGLDINFTDKGLLIPRLTTAQRDAIVSPADGLMIINSEEKCFQVYDSINSTWRNIKCWGCCECSSLTNYDVFSISYNWVSGSGTSISLGDDQVSGAINIGFDFCFYGNTYNQVYISSNGFITFTSGSSSGCCSGQSVPNTNSPNNLIALNWTDLNPNYGGSISYFTTGTAPNRQFVVTFQNIGEYSNSSYQTTAQIVLYECSGNIDINIQSISINTHTATQSIENQGGTNGVGVPGRNTITGPFSISNESWRFTPVCN